VNKIRIAIDMDETVCDSLSRHLDWYNRDFNTRLTKENTKGKKLREIVPEEHLEIVKSYPTHPNFFRDLDVFDGAIDGIRMLSDEYEIFFATAAMEYPTSFNAKHDWLKSHFPFINDLNFIFCGFKGILNTDFLIDDTPNHLNNFSGVGILFDAPHNLAERNYHRVFNWKDIVEGFQNDKFI
jgi:5'(3')-deoxyribonucleotidase